MTLFATGYATLWSLPLVVATVPVMLAFAAAGVLLLRSPAGVAETAARMPVGTRPRRAGRAGAARRERTAPRVRIANPRGGEGR